MKIYFKNGTSVEIIEEMGEKLHSRISEGCNKFVVFKDKDGKLLLILNVDEVVYIQ